MTAPSFISFAPDRRVLFLTKDLSLIKEQLYNGLNLAMADIRPDDLLDDINTDIMTPAWVCFHHDPHEIAKRAYAGLTHQGKRIFEDGALMNGRFQAIVSGKRKGTGSSRETAAQCEHYAGIHLIFAESFAPIHQRNNINLGQIMGSYDLLKRLQQGESIHIDEFLKPFDRFSQRIIRAGGLFAFLKNVSFPTDAAKNAQKPLTMAQKIIAKKMVSADHQALLDNSMVVAQVDSGYSHEFTTAQVHQFLRAEYGEDYTIKNGSHFAAFEDHLIYTDQVEAYKKHVPLIADLRKLQKEFIKKNNIKDYSAKNGVSPGICHEVARQDFILPGDLIQATDSHTCMGGALNAFAFGVGATEYASILATGLSVIKVPGTVRFDLVGRLAPNCTAKDIMLFILLHFAKTGVTLDKVMEFGGDGLKTLNLDERATLCNMATECAAKTGICEPDEMLIEWLLEHRTDLSKDKVERLLVKPDNGCSYQARHTIDLANIKPMVAHPGNPDLGIPSDPTNGILVEELPEIAIDIAYGGSCTAGKYADLDMYALITRDALARGLSIKPRVQFFIQYGSQKVESYAKHKGYHDDFRRAGITVIPPGCGACIGCGPGVSTKPEQVTISAINRNFQGRSGPGKLYLASPLTVAASAFAGTIVAWEG